MISFRSRFDSRASRMKRHGAIRKKIILTPFSFRERWGRVGD
jgi:hypothetical protein